jgi:hypothetical protein
MTKKSAAEKDTSLFRLLANESHDFCSRTSPMTHEEFEILAALREIKKQTREIKSRLAAISPDWKQWLAGPERSDISGEARSHIRELEQLRIKWKECEEAWEKARHRRMVALGHEDP